MIPLHGLPHAPERPRHPLNLLGLEVVEINEANGWDVQGTDQWDDKYPVPAKLALIHSEVSEALEAFREGDFDNFAEELADVVIRVLDLSTQLEIDLDTEVARKLEKNRGRGHRHGGKRV